MTESEVAAEVVVCLIEHKMLKFTPPVIVEAATALGIPVALIRKRWAAKEDLGRGFSDRQVSDMGKLIPIKPGRPLGSK